MARPNPEAERLERENALLRKQLGAMRADPGDIPVRGCGDYSCEVAKPTGMHTNGGCRCEERELRRALRWWKRVAEFRLATIKDMRDRGEHMPDEDPYEDTPGLRKLAGQE